MKDLETQKGRSVALFVGIVLIWLLAGSLRKWAIPGMSSALFFARDPLLLLLWIRACKYGDQQLATLRTLAAWFAGSMLIVAGILAIVNSQSLSIAYYGWRLYCGWLLTGVAGASVLNSDDMERILRWLLRLAPIMAMLGVAQSMSPATAAVNSIGEVGANIGTTSNGIVRTSLTFTSPAGATGYIVLVAATLILIKRKGAWDRTAAPIGVVLLVATSGSRSVIFLASGVLLAALAVQFLARPGAALFGICRLGVIVVLGYIFALALLPDVVSAFAQRFVNAAASENTSGRVAYNAFGFLNDLTRAPGWGLGLGGASRGSSANVWIETDLSRNIFELGPVLGLIFILGRWLLALLLLVGAIKAMSRRNSVLSVVCAAQMVPILFIGQLTGQGSVHELGGILLAGALIGMKSIQGASPDGGSRVNPALALPEPLTLDRIRPSSRSRVLPERAETSSR